MSIWCKACENVLFFLSFETKRVLARAKNVKNATEKKNKIFRYSEVCTNEKYAIRFMHMLYDIVIERKTRRVFIYAFCFSFSFRCRPLFLSWLAFDAFWSSCGMWNASAIQPSSRWQNECEYNECRTMSTSKRTTTTAMAKKKKRMRSAKMENLHFSLNDRHVLSSSTSKCITESKKKKTPSGAMLLMMAFHATWADIAFRMVCYCCRWCSICSSFIRLFVSAIDYGCFCSCWAFIVLRLFSCSMRCVPTLLHTACQNQATFITTNTEKKNGATERTQIWRQREIITQPNTPRDRAKKKTQNTKSVKTPSSCEKIISVGGVRAQKRERKLIHYIIMI